MYTIPNTSHITCTPLMLDGQFLAVGSSLWQSGTVIRYGINSPTYTNTCRKPVNLRKIAATWFRDILTSCLKSYLAVAKL